VRVFSEGPTAIWLSSGMKASEVQRLAAQAQASKKKRQPAKSGGLGTLAIVSVVVAVFVASSLHQYRAELTRWFVRLLPSDASTKRLLASKLKQASKDKRPPPLVAKFEPLGLESIEWRVGGRFMRKLADGEMPVLITSSPVKSWPASSWDLLKIARAHPDLILNMSSYKAGRNSVFVLGNEREKGGMLGSSKNFNVVSVNIALQTFLEETFVPNVSVIYRAEASSLERAINQTLGDWSALAINEKSLDDPESAQIGVLQLSHPGAVLHTHYLPRHVVVNQIQGYRRIHVFPPTREEAEFLYPSIHRAFAFSQLHLEEAINSTIFPSLSSEAGLGGVADVTLSPGDSLYIPAYWAFREESLTISLALHVESPSSSSSSFTEAFSQPIPLGELQSSQELRGLGVAVLLEGIVSKGVTLGCLPTDTTLKMLVGDVLEKRYRPYLRAGSSSASTIALTMDPTACFAHRENATVAALLTSIAPNVDIAANQVAASICKAKTAAPVKIRILLDYIEQLARWATSPRLTYAFLSSCLA